MVLLDIGFEGSVLSRSQTRRRTAFSKRDHVIVNKVFVVAGRVGIKFVLRDFFAWVTGHRHLLPMEVKTGRIDESLPEGKDLSSCRIVLGLQKDHGGTVFAYSRGVFAQISPADVGTLLWIVLI